MALSETERNELLIKQGRTPFGVQIEMRDSKGGIAPHDGETFGPLWCAGRGWPQVTSRAKVEACWMREGWFPTGDVATWDRFGSMKITDRTKDVIKSGGEWISSIDVENAAMSHPEGEAGGDSGIVHPKWDERPVLVIVPADSGAPGKEEILEYLSSRMAKWWLPDDVVFVTEMPMTATGKILKAEAARAILAPPTRCRHRDLKSREQSSHLHRGAPDLNSAATMIGSRPILHS